jgi:hypothetical protein
VRRRYDDVKLAGSLGHLLPELGPEMFTAKGLVADNEIAPHGPLLARGMSRW